MRQQGYASPTPVQAESIPAILRGGDLLAAAQTGTGKTAGFTLPLLQRLMSTWNRDQRSVRALVVVPTRELAAQVGESVRAYGAHLPLRHTVIFGGVGMQPQISALRRGVDIVIATPGRLLDHARSHDIDLSRLDILVLDEADRMLDMGFLPDIRRILRLLPEKRQNLLFSATFPDAIRKLAEDLLDRPKMIQVAERNSAAATVTQTVYRVDRARKTELLAELVQQENWAQVLVFTRTKHGSDRLARKLGRADIPAAAIHGNKSQSARTRALADFKAGRIQALVATDIAARGLDIDGLPHVVNFELPYVPEDYVHRIGRTGRAGADGEAVSLVCVDEDKLLRDIERLLRRKLDSRSLAGFEPDPAVRPEPLRQGSGRTPRSPTATMTERRGAPSRGRPSSRRARA